MKLGEKVQLLRKNHNMSQEVLAQKLEINRNCLSRIETGKSEPSISVISSIAEVCGSSLEELFYYDINQYSKDKELILLLKKCNEKKKQAIIDLLNS